jgi:adenosylmethionine-8-amino-7-oxononanoate aminotransferase
MNTHIINSQLICANYEQEYPLIEKGEGVYLYDNKGNKYLDASGCTACVTNIGHGVKEVADVLATQAHKLAVHPTHTFYNQELENYLSKLCDFMPEGFNHAWTISGGTEALENAIKLSYQYHRSKDQRRTKVLGRWGSYHGNSLTMLDVGGNFVRRDYYTDLMVDYPHVSPCFPYRKPEEQTLEQYEDSLIKEFEATVQKHQDDIICFVAEPFVGAALGAVGPTKNYFKSIYDICTKNDILFISDEVMTGFGRTGKNFGIEHFGVTPDIIAMAKGISSGYFPLGAIGAHDRVINTIRESGKPFFSGQTYSCIPLAAAVGEAVLNYINKHKLVNNSKQIGSYLKEKFLSLMELPYVGDVRGEGLFLGIEFVKDKQTKEPIEPSFMFAKKVETAALEVGLSLYACRGTVELTKGDHLLITPPLTLTQQQADELYEKLLLAIEKVSSQLT